MSLTKVSYSMIDGTFINVRDYGATGDGVTDDSAAIQAAIDAAGNKTVFFPKPSGAYYKLIAHGLTINANTNIAGESWETSIYNASSEPTITLDTLARTKISDIQLIGDAGAYGAGGTVTQHGIYVGPNTQHFKFDRVWIYRAGGHGILIDGAYTGSMSDGQCNDCGVDGVTVRGYSGSPSAVASQVTIADWVSKTNGRHGFLIDGNTVGANLVHCVNLFAINNTDEQIVGVNCGWLTVNTSLFEIDGGAPSPRPTYEARFNVVTALSLDGIATTNAASVQVQGCNQGIVTNVRPDTGSGAVFDFATDNVNVWYQQSGTWTPVVEINNATTGITYAANGQIGYYEKFGNSVRASGHIALSSKGALTGNVTVSGLPYPIKNIAYYTTLTGQANRQSNLNTVSGPVIFEGIGGASEMSIVQVSSGSTVALTDANLTNTTELYFVVEYIVN